MKLTFAILLTLFITYSAHSQTSPIVNIGTVNTVDINDQKVKITTDQKIHIELTVYSPSIVRVRMDNQELAEDFSYAVISKPQETKVNITQNNAEIRLLTDSLQTIIRD